MNTEFYLEMKAAIEAQLNEYADATARDYRSRKHLLETITKGLDNLAYDMPIEYAMGMRILVVAWRSMESEWMRMTAERNELLKQSNQHIQTIMENFMDMEARIGLDITKPQYN